MAEIQGVIRIADVKRTAEHLAIFFPLAVMKDISFIESLYRVLTLAVKQFQEPEALCEKTIQIFLATLIEAALSSVGIAKAQLRVLET